MKEMFIEREFMASSLNGALQRSYTYADVPEQDKENFREALRQRLRDISRQYDNQVDDDSHIANIEALSNDLSQTHVNVFRGGRFRIGIAQKALNLYLKYLWCAGFIEPIPPHCPFDSIVISHLPECKDFKWTSIDNIDEYRRLVLAAKRVAAAKPLAEWELEIWESAR